VGQLEEAVVVVVEAGCAHGEGAGKVQHIPWFQLRRRQGRSNRGGSRAVGKGVPRWAWGVDANAMRAQIFDGMDNESRTQALEKWN
jgi:hypothetical protein